MNRNNPTLFIGFDAAEPELISRWAAAGLLPTFSRLMQEGSTIPLRPLPGMGDGATWPTLVTGVNPARHGRYFRRQFRPNSYGAGKPFSVESDLRYAPFWSVLAEAGRKVAILDLPYTPLTRGAGSLILADWLIHDSYESFRSWPPDFASRVGERWGNDPVHGSTDRMLAQGHSLSSVCDLLLRRATHKKELIVETLASGQWDFLAGAFTESHDMGHIAWHMHDPAHPRHDPDWVDRYGDPLQRLYVALDASLAEILDVVPEQANVVIFVGLGMGPNYTANNLMEAILCRLDGDRPQPRRVKRGASRLRREWARLVAMHARSRRRFFTVPHNENSGAIRINLRGREPLGKVALRSYDDVCEELTDAFLELTDPATGTPVVSGVVKVHDHFAGENLDAMPDLFACWNRPGPFAAVSSSRLGVFEGAASWGRSGDHTANSALFAVGPDAAALGAGGPAARVVDIAPTLAALQGLELPVTDGRPLQSG